MQKTKQNMLHFTYLLTSFMEYAASCEELLYRDKKQHKGPLSFGPGHIGAH